MELTLNEITYKLFIFSSNDKSSKSFPHRLIFLILCNESDVVFVNISYVVNGFPSDFVHII
jgi:hypothetical protein